ncbi:restriction endonuclease [Rhodococcoides kyotonense]|uniref:Restriction endonuclease n=1 Tax=Rhodococcoides kyotonense TaxID=398843 RepID=A0A239MY37_9NOCA|nr:restriction endonuclease [Rhodococcus kyotonensis]SNT46779.1 Restriction endonuclease [Rhodococcus kyotonensis]
MMTPEQAEIGMAHAMTQMGYKGARALPVGPDAGIDIKAHGGIAQVKRHRVPVGRPDLQRLYGARGNSHHMDMLFFSYSGYTAQALQYGNEVGIKLFRFDDKFNVYAVNAYARRSTGGGIVKASGGDAKYGRPVAFVATVCAIGVIHLIYPFGFISILLSIFFMWGINSEVRKKK